ncbi:hypothetical protein K490DRAFT_52670 [Saccharata proteae CBS 121410]|uniref:Uncharacterized protein n=1 Tax=Saccharata proteae CBS 121410 TaxID=1314787 RepID=A0A9P4I0W2_9PEZI|nr:hypothetical protein K490DRAFT_52670 [Saccharata proteae CBS 121410]
MASAPAPIVVSRARAVPVINSTPGDDAVTWFETLIPAIVFISTFGSLITLTVVVSGIADPARLDPVDPSTPTGTQFRRETVRTLLAVAWLLFVLALGASNFAALLLVFHRHDVRDGFSGVRRREDPKKLLGRAVDYRNVGVYVAVGLPVLVMGAFLALSLAVVAYVGPVVIGSFIDKRSSMF